MNSIKSVSCVVGSNNLICEYCKLKNDLSSRHLLTCLCIADKHNKDDNFKSFKMPTPYEFREENKKLGSVPDIAGKIQSIIRGMKNYRNLTDIEIYDITREYIDNNKQEYDGTLSSKSTTDLVLWLMKHDDSKDYSARVKDASKLFSEITDDELCRINYKIVKNSAIQQSHKFKSIMEDNGDDFLISMRGNQLPSVLTNNINPLIVALFGNKLWSLDFQIIWGDPYRVIQSCILGNTAVMDPADVIMFSSKIVNNDNELSDEDFVNLEKIKIIINSRVTLAIASMRSGNFYSDLNSKLISLINNCPLIKGDDFIDKFLYCTDITTINYGKPYKNIKFGGFTNPIHTTAGINEIRFIQSTENSNDLRYIPAKSGAQGGKSLSEIVGGVKHNGYLVIRVSRNEEYKQKSELDIMRETFSTNKNTNLRSAGRLKNEPITFPNEITDSIGKTLVLASIVGYNPDRNGEEYGSYWTVIFDTTTDRMFYYSDDFGIQRKKLWDYCEGSNNNQDVVSDYSYFKPSDFIVSNDKIDEVKHIISTRGIIYVYKDINTMNGNGL